MFGDTPLGELTKPQLAAYALVCKKRLDEADPSRVSRRRAYDKDWKQRNKGKFPAYYRKYRLKAEYGITPEQYDAMLRAQGGRCAICLGREPGNWHNKLVIDHDHKTGRVRELLCHNCNMFIGHADDDEGILRRAAAYLVKHRRRATETHVGSAIRDLLEPLSSEGREGGSAEGMGCAASERGAA
jgi:hypothetical protein